MFAHSAERRWGTKGDETNPLGTISTCWDVRLSRGRPLGCQLATVAALKDGILAVCPCDNVKGFQMVLTRLEPRRGDPTFTDVLLQVSAINECICLCSTGHTSAMRAIL